MHAVEHDVSSAWHLLDQKMLDQKELEEQGHPPITTDALHVWLSHETVWLRLLCVKERDPPDGLHFCEPTNAGSGGVARLLQGCCSINLAKPHAMPSHGRQCEERETNGSQAINGGAVVYRAA